MKLQVLGSSSRGNGYILHTIGGDALAIEAGAKASEYFATIKPSQYAGVLVSHEHKDHAASALQMAAQYGVKVIASKGTIHALGIPSYLATEVSHLCTTEIKGWKITPVRVIHDAEGPCAFIIERGSTKLLFATDLAEFPRIPVELLKGVNVLMLEANYDAEIAIRSGANMTHLDRVSNSHLSIAQAEEVVKYISSLGCLEMVILIHLSNDNSDEVAFKERIENAAPEAKVMVADKGLIVNDLSFWQW